MITIKSLIGWTLTITGLVAMLGFGLAFVFSTLLTLTGKYAWGIWLLYLFATAGSYFVWKSGGKLRGR